VIPYKYADTLVEDAFIAKFGNAYAIERDGKRRVTSIQFRIQL